MSEVKWPRYFCNSATPAWTARQDARGMDSKVFLLGKLQNVTQSASSVDNLVRDGVWIETDAEGNEIVPEVPVVRYACSKAAKVGDRVKFAGNGVTRTYCVEAIEPTGMLWIRETGGEAFNFTPINVHSSAVEFVPEVAAAKPDRLASLESFHAAIVSAMNNEHNPTRFALAVSRALGMVEQEGEVGCE